MRQLRLIRTLFEAVVALGMVALLVGLFFIPALPYYQYDAVLTPDELRDPQIKERTLNLLKRALGNQGPLCTLFGVTLTAVGGLGRHATHRLIDQWLEIRVGEDSP